MWPQQVQVQQQTSAGHGSGSGFAPVLASFELGLVFSVKWAQQCLPFPMPDCEGVALFLALTMDRRGASLYSFMTL